MREARCGGCAVPQEGLMDGSGANRLEQAAQVFPRLYASEAIILVFLFLFYNIPKILLAFGIRRAYKVILEKSVSKKKSQFLPLTLFPAAVAVTSSQQLKWYYGLILGRSISRWLTLWINVHSTHI